MTSVQRKLGELSVISYDTSEKFFKEILKAGSRAYVSSEKGSVELGLDSEPEGSQGIFRMRHTGRSPANPILDVRPTVVVGSSYVSYDEHARSDCRRQIWKVGVLYILFDSPSKYI
jgi:hypothetical protein